MRRVLYLCLLAATACGSGPPDLSPAAQEGWAAYLAGSYVEPWPNGKYIVDGDLAFATEEALLEHYLSQVAPTDAPDGFGVSRRSLLVYNLNGTDIIQPTTRRFRLTYCISDGFGDRKGDMVNAMWAATRSWADIVGVEFHYVPGEDDDCTAGNTNVYFDIRAVQTDTYRARAFFPNDQRAARNILVAPSAFTATGDVDLEGILRHELGHTLGFKHEHIRLHSPDSDEPDIERRDLTGYDENSVMHYPDLRSPPGGGYRQTRLDYRGARSIYGVAPALILTSSPI